MQFQHNWNGVLRKLATGRMGVNSFLMLNPFKTGSTFGGPGGQAVTSFIGNG